jgi:hypothetical protein
MDEKFMKILVGIPEGKGPLRRRNIRWEENVRIKMWARFNWLSICTSDELL